MYISKSLILYRGQFYLPGKFGNVWRDAWLSQIGVLVLLASGGRSPRMMPNTPRCPAQRHNGNIQLKVSGEPRPRNPGLDNLLPELQAAYLIFCCGCIIDRLNLRCSKMSSDLLLLPHTCFSCYLSHLLLVAQQKNLGVLPSLFVFHPIACFFVDLVSRRVCW